LIVITITITIVEVCILELMIPDGT